jgi:glycosyltransferase involved in cell wall biosynthesis
MAVARELPMSVVVMGYRNHDTIVGAVRSVLEQASADPYEVVVVVSGGDDSGNLIRGAFPELAVVDSPARLLPGAARNAGVENTRGDVVAFLAADCMAEPGWVAARLAAHRAGRMIVASAVTNGGRDRPWSWASYFDLFSGRLSGRPGGVVRPPDPAAHGLSYARSVLEQLGGFDEQLPAGEDTAAAVRADGLGFEVWFEPSIRTAHVGPSGTKELVCEQYRRGALRARVAAADLRPTTPWRALIAFVPVWSIWLRTRVVRSWRYAPELRSRLLLCLPWLAVARAAGVAGWYRERLRGSRAGASDARALGARRATS